MFKDYNKYLKASLKVYIFVLLIVFILKLVGLDYFGLDYNLANKIESKINVFPINYTIQFILLSFQLYLLTSIAIKGKAKIRESIIVTVINMIISFTLFLLGFYKLYSLTSIIIVFVYFIIKKIKVKRIIKIILINSLLQIISNITRNNNVFEYYFAISIILNIDYMVMLLIWNNLIKGGVDLCQYQHLGSSLLKKKHLSDLLEKLQRNYSNFKKYNKVDKATIVIYTILSLIWNIFTIIVVLFVAKLNDTFIECLFIISSFWLSKKVFGKPFHLKSMIGCFIISNASYYVLNRVTTPIGISILVPIMLGVGLSYVTSKFVKDIKPLFKGMSEEDFNNTILRVVEKDSDKYKICYDFFINKENAVSLGYKYHYTEHGIRKIIYRINEKIKTLN